MSLKLHEDEKNIQSYRMSKGFCNGIYRKQTMLSLTDRRMIIGKESIDYANISRLSGRYVDGISPLGLIALILSSLIFILGFISAASEVLFMTGVVAGIVLYFLSWTRLMYSRVELSIDYFNGKETVTKKYCFICQRELAMSFMDKLDGFLPTGRFALNRSTVILIWKPLLLGK